MYSASTRCGNIRVTPEGRFATAAFRRWRVPKPMIARSRASGATLEHLPAHGLGVSYSSLAAESVRGKLRAHAARDERELIVRGELAQPVERAAVDERDARAVACRSVDHEPHSVVVTVIESGMRCRRSRQRPRDSFRKMAALGCCQELQR